MDWLIFAVFAAVFFGLYNYFSGKTGYITNPVLASFILYLSATFITFIVLVFHRIQNPNIQATQNGIKFAVIAGLVAGIADICYLVVFSKKVEISIVLPLVFTITTIVGALLGIILEKETVSVAKILGIFLALAGVSLIYSTYKQT